jgi:tryptophan synthase alpha chain
VSVAAEQTGVERIAAAFAASDKRAALMPYVMGGFPTIADSIAIGHACVQAGADIIELGVPYSDPLADGPVIHDADTRALAAGASLAGVLEVARALAPTSRWCSCATRTWSSPPAPAPSWSAWRRPGPAA